MSNISPAKPNRSILWLAHLPKLPFFSDTDWRSMISRSGLPDQVQAVVLRVVTESKLSRTEKTQVTKELLAHFADGNERGKPFPELIEDFGDPTTVAALIRISKLRNRTMISKLFRGSFWAGLTGLGCYLGLAAFFNMESPHVSVDYISEFNQAAISAAEEDKAWNVYRDVWLKHEFLDHTGLDEIYLRKGDLPVRFVKPTDGKPWKIAIKKLEDSKELLESFRVGGTLPALGLALQVDRNKYSPEDQAALFPKHPAGEPFDASTGMVGLSTEADQLFAGSMIDVLLPHIQMFREAARVLRVDTRWAMEQGDTGRATRNIEAVFGMGDQAGQTPCLVGSLVEVAVRGIGYSVIDESMSHGKFAKFDQQQLARIQLAVSQYSCDDMLAALRAERIFVNDLIQRIYSDDGNGDGRMTPVGQEVLFCVKAMMQSSWADDLSAESELERFFASKGVQQITGPMSFLTMPTRKQINEKHDEIMTEIESRFNTPVYLDDMSDMAWEDKRAELESDGYQLLSYILPACLTARQAMFRGINNQGGVEIAIASYRYHKQYGAFPESSEDLVGEFLDAIPTDQFNGDPLNYKLTENGFKVYSVGSDLDDDGGQPIMVEAKVSTDARAESMAEELGRLGPLAAVDGKRPLAAGEFDIQIDFRSIANSKAEHPDADGDWVIWPRYAEAQDDLRE